MDSKVTKQNYNKLYPKALFTRFDSFKCIIIERRGVGITKIHNTYKITDLRIVRNMGL